MSATLKVTEHHNATKVAYMERISGRVCTKVSSHHLLLEKFLCPWHNLCEHTAPFEFFY